MKGVYSTIVFDAPKIVKKDVESANRSSDYPPHDLSRRRETEKQVELPVLSAARRAPQTHRKPRGACVANHSKCDDANIRLAAARALS